MAADDDDAAEIGPADAPVPPLPRENPALIGHEAAETGLLAAYNAGKLPHAWLITGPRGVGKATLAYRFARFLFAQSGEAGGLFAAPPSSLALAASHRAFRLVASGSHPDLLVVERGVDPKRRRQRREIVAEDARGIAEFLHLTASQDGWRVVLVDGADNMNFHAANSLLKVLEEPPQKTVMLLTSDNPGRLLPTIRSRCRLLPLKPLSSEQITTLLEGLRPDLSDSDRSVLTRLGDGSIGRALDLAASGGLDIYSHIVKILESLPKLDSEALHGFAEGLARSGGDDGFALLNELLPGQIARLVALGAENDAAASRGDELLRRLARRRSLDQWVTVWEKLTHLFAQAEGINLDRKQVVLNAFFVLEEAAR